MSSVTLIEPLASKAPYVLPGREIVRVHLALRLLSLSLNDSTQQLLLSAGESAGLRKQTYLFSLAFH